MSTVDILIKKLKDKIVFPSKEEKNRIEHMDIGYKEFFKLIQKIADESYAKGYDDCKDEYDD